MKNKTLMMTMLVAVLMSVLAPAAFAGGQTSATLENAGWDCFEAGPNNWTHCVAPSTANGTRSPEAKGTVVKIFSVDGSEFLGTELLISASVYAGQPCSTDGGGAYGYVPPLDAYACHRFSTGG
jgi:hypothetical protein